jgi:hypothetical protein
MNRLVASDADKSDDDDAGDSLSSGSRELERQLEECENSLKTWEQMRTVLEMLVMVKLAYRTFPAP